uniref:Uncharacterized protein n=2 Tax=Meloidogyne TaxID=189290 RepID=A0A6V7VJN0_MELEN|nr:unnamed protein product [Meloidogyne enterolobii]
MKNKKIFFPVELLSEIVHFIPLNLRWSKIRVYKIFDILIFNHLKRWIIYLKSYKDDVVASVTDLTGLFSRNVNFDNLERQDLLKLHQAIDYVQVGVTVMENFNGVPRLDNWPILDLHRQVGHLRTCYTSIRDELADLFTRQKKFFVEKNVVDFEEWKSCLGALKGYFLFYHQLIRLTLLKCDLNMSISI